ncbi:hypothetical protein HDR61_04945 [bacterium]|nr:hypothetical protein [bacterium]
MNKPSTSVNFKSPYLTYASQSVLHVLDSLSQKALIKLSKDMIARNGLNYQISICMEEISELVTELVLDTSFDNTAAEIADVFITLHHVVVGYDIRRAVNTARRKKIKQPQFMSGNNERLLALLDLQKELIKHTNRKKDNMAQIVERTADAYIVLAKLIISRDNLAMVHKTIYEKIQRTYLRNK